MGRMIQWECFHELNALRLLDADEAVTACHEQPLTIRFVLDGKARIRYPDLLVERPHWTLLYFCAKRPEIVRTLKGRGPLVFRNPCTTRLSV
jgi:hypothetical protein